MNLSVILHADDFGLNSATDAGIVEGFSRGLLSSTSLLVNAPHAQPAVQQWKELLDQQRAGEIESRKARERLGDAGTPFDLGAHINLTQGRPLTGARFADELLGDQGLFLDVFQLFRRLKTRGSLAGPLAAEIGAQIQWLRDHGLKPTHLNGHQYVEMLPAVAALLPELLARFEVPVVRVAWEPALARNVLWRDRRLGSWLLAIVKRHYARRLRVRLRGTPVACPGVYFGTAHAGRIDLASMAGYLGSAPAEGSVEIGMHPGQPSHDEPAEDCWRDPLADRRPGELALLTSTELVELLASRGITLGRLSALRHPRPRAG